MNVEFNSLRANYFQSLSNTKNEIVNILQLNDPASMCLQQSIYNTAVLLNLKGILIDPFWIAISFLCLSSISVDKNELIEIFEETQFDECKFFAFVFHFTYYLADYYNKHNAKIGTNLNISVLNCFDAKNPFAILKMHKKYPNIIKMISENTHYISFLEWIENTTKRKILICPEKITKYVEYFRQCRVDINRQKSFLN